MTTIRDNTEVKGWTQKDLEHGDVFTWGERLLYYLYVDGLTVIDLSNERTNTIGDLVDFHEPLSIVKTLEVTEWK